MRIVAKRVQKSVTSVNANCMSVSLLGINKYVLIFPYLLLTFNILKLMWSAVRNEPNQLTQHITICKRLKTCYLDNLIVIRYLLFITTLLPIKAILYVDNIESWSEFRCSERIPKVVGSFTQMSVSDVYQVEWTIMTWIASADKIYFNTKLFKHLRDIYI